MISFNCSCGKKLQARPEAAGKKVRCPGCGNVATVPSLASGSPTGGGGGVMTIGAGASTSWEEESGGRSGGGCLFRIFSMFVLLVMLAGGGVGGWFGTQWLVNRVGLGGGPPNSIVGYIPGDAAGFVSVRLADVWKADSAKPATNMIKMTNKTQLDEMKKAIGIQPEDVKRIVFVLLDAPSVEDLNSRDFAEKKLNYWTLIETLAPYDKNKPLNAKDLDSKKIEYNGKKYYRLRPKLRDDKKVTKGDKKGKKDEKGRDEKGEGEPTGKDNDNVNLFFVSPTVALVASKEGVKRFIDGIGKPRDQDGPLKKAIDAAENKHFVIAGLVKKEWRDKGKEQPIPDQMKKAAVLLEITAGWIAVHDADALINANFHFTFAEEKFAKEAVTTANFYVNEGKSWLAKLKKAPADMNPFPADLLTAGEKFLADLKIQQSGADVEVSMNVDASKIQAAVSLMMKLNGGGP